MTANEIQCEFMKALDRAGQQKELAAELNVDPSLISRWFKVGIPIEHFGTVLAWAGKKLADQGTRNLPAPLIDTCDRLLAHSFNSGLLGSLAK